MICNKSWIWFIFVIATVFADDELSKDLHERSKQISHICGKKFNFEEKDYRQNFHKMALSKDISEKYLCFLKCFHETDGVIDKKGVINFKRADEILSMLKFKDEEMKNITACLKETKPVIKCKDVVSPMKCIPEKKSEMY